MELARRGFRRLTGADYSAASIDLGAAVLEKHGLLSAVRLMVRGRYASPQSWPKTLMLTLSPVSWHAVEAEAIDRVSGESKSSWHPLAALNANSIKRGHGQPCLL